MAEYQLSIIPTVIIRTSDMANIPMDEENSDYKAYLKWVDEGNTPDPIPLPDRIRAKINELDIKLAAEKFKNIELNGNTYFGDASSQTLINQALASYERGYTDAFPAEWILPNGSTVTSSYDDIKALSFALAGRTKLCYDNYRALAIEVHTSPNPENVDINVGWPT